MSTHLCEAPLTPTHPNNTTTRHVAHHRYRRTTNPTRKSASRFLRCDFPCAAVLPPIPDTRSHTLPIHNAAVRS